MVILIFRYRKPLLRDGKELIKMKIELEQKDIQAIAITVIENLRPLLNNRKVEEDDIIFNVQGIAEYLGVSPKWIYERTHLKEIPHIKVAGQLRFRKKDINKWLDSFNIPAVNSPARILKPKVKPTTAVK